MPHLRKPSKTAKIQKEGTPAGTSMGYVPWEALTKIGTWKKTTLWAQWAQGPKKALGPNGTWAETGPGPNRLKLALGPNGPRPKRAPAQIG